MQLVDEPDSICWQVSIPPALGYACTEQAASDKAAHVVIAKRA